ncbi:hypothetical protein pEaSNUABM46_00233 [Erwinia phage pEa_SNUABM_46]|nr:hypothetical protein pEaSNUABM45_00233 [Erwinia phage pEa_SNUABM_45]QYW04217.1 hypothetical protein pEaSNUABM46_00233 [Erwinia phage pEa_SNUABM_46]QYW05246.1 hypothetical protein pEaSNUABM21_00232 [Erwinia phage pEa_SNUABM_21]
MTIVYISLSQTSSDKNRDRVSSPESNTGRVDVSEYASLEKKLRLTEEAKDKEKLAQKAGGGDSVKNKKAKPKADDAGGDDDAKDDDASFDDFDTGDDDDDADSDASKGKKSNKAKGGKDKSEETDGGEPSSEDGDDSAEGDDDGSDDDFEDEDA